MLRYLKAVQEMKRIIEDNDLVCIREANNFASVRSFYRCSVACDGDDCSIYLCLREDRQT